MRGDALQTTNAFLALPTSLNQQAAWLYDLGMCQLEAGMPLDAVESLTKALTLAPGLAVRPIAAYYLEKMGQPVPPPPKNARAKRAVDQAPVDPLKASPVIPPPRKGALDAKPMGDLRKP